MLVKLGTQHLDESSSKKLEALKPQAFSKLQSLIEKNCEGSEHTGWWEWPEHYGFESLRQIREHILKIDVTYNLIVVVGIGGSYAGTKAVADALRHQFSDQLFNVPQRYLPIIYAGNHLSERGLVELLDVMDEYEPIVNIVSKSGSTIEPNVAFRILEESMHKRFGREASRRIFVSTQSDKNPLHQLAEKRNYKVFPIPQSVGGRYSVLTCVGLLPLSLAGYDCEQLLSGADRLFSELREDPSEHTVLQYASFRKMGWDEGKILDVVSYKEPKLASLIEWYKQLFAESEGKEARGLMPMGMCYSTDLHSLGQYLQEGPACMIESFVNIGPSSSFLEKRVKIPEDDTVENKNLNFLFKRYVNEIDQAAWEASQAAHAQRGVPCIELKVPQLDEYHLGYLIAFFQCACAVSALLLDVNPFNQPGVEVYKKKLYEILGN